MSEPIKKIFGIDLGTTYSSIAFVDEYGKPVIIPNAENQRITPSVVFFDGSEIVVGDVAKESAKLYPNEVVSFIKRSMGEADYVFEYDNKTYRPEEISSFILRKVAQDAEQTIGEKVRDVVITCPAYFGINEREATRKAGEIAGFNVRQIINEPTAAAIAYGTVQETENRTVLVYDLGGGTFDITMIDIQENSIDVICTGGDHNLGGKDWDDRIVSFLVQEFQRQTGSTEDILEDPDTWQDLQLSAEKSKKILSQRDKTPISITHGGERVKVELGRNKFEEISRDLLERTVSLTHEMLTEAKNKGYERFDEIIMVGGSTRMPQIPERIRREFNMEPRMFDPDEAIAKGAAIYGWKLSLNDGLIRRIAEKTNRNPDAEPDIMETTPANIMEEVVRQMSEETGVTLSAVRRSTISINDVTSKSFGVVARRPNNSEAVFNLILKNTTVPVDTKRSFYTPEANQERVLIRIMENESTDKVVPVEHSAEIGTAVLVLPAGLPEDSPVEIEFQLNREGRLLITAVETNEFRKVTAKIETRSVIQGKELEEAMARSQSLIVH
jgi:molecular chaperone DnaK (HSP70)